MLKEILSRLEVELLALLLAMLWVALRAVAVVIKRAENGQPLTIRILGRSFIEVQGEDEHPTPQANAGTLREEEYVTLKTANPMLSSPMGGLDL